MPLKIKIFFWYLIKNVALAKDNLPRKRWKGSLKCVGCNLDESIQHLFFDCYIARCVWRSVQVSFNILPPTSMQHLFDNWLEGVDLKLKYKIWVGACALCWAIWLCRNDVVFNNTRVSTPMQVVFRRTHWIRFWAQLQKEDDRPQMKWGCRVLETTMMHIFSSNGWNFSNRLCL